MPSVFTNGVYLFGALPFVALLISHFYNKPFNWVACAALLLGAAVGQATFRLGLSQLHLLAGYSVLAAVVFFFFDRYSAFVLATFGLVIGAHIFGFIDHRPKVIAGEVMLFAGIIFCAFNGPSGGLRADDSSISDSGRSSSNLGAAQAIPQDSQSAQKER